jgi:hypothetical protein
MSTLRKKGPLEPLIDKTWRTFTTIVVLGLGASVVVIPLVLLIPLLVESLTPGNIMNQNGLLWLWASMTFIELALAVFIIWGMFRAAFGLWQGPMYPKK